MLRTSWAALALVVAAVAPAFAEDNAQNLELPKGARGTTRVLVPTPPDAFTPHAATISPYIYLNRCTGGCQVMHSNLNDARTNQSSIPKMGSGCPGYPTCTVAEYKDVDGLSGANGKCRGGTAAGTACTDATEATACTGGGTCYTADDEWAEVVQCMKEVYSPFAVTVTDARGRTHERARAPAMGASDAAHDAGREASTGCRDQARDQARGARDARARRQGREQGHEPGADLRDLRTGRRDDHDQAA
jgi:hypothetical protein